MRRIRRVKCISAFANSWMVRCRDRAVCCEQGKVEVRASDNEDVNVRRSVSAWRRGLKA